MVDAFNIMQDRITRARLAGDPPDATIHARLEEIGMFDFHKAEQLIAAGREAAARHQRVVGRRSTRQLRS